MYITLETDYAIRIVDSLARGGCRMGAQGIAKKSDTTLRFTLKILRKLVLTGIIRSFKGVQGGYEIARPLCEISVNDIVEAIEGPYSISRCLRPSYICARNGDDDLCVYHRRFEELSEQIREQLKSMTLDRMLDDNL